VADTLDEILQYDPKRREGANEAILDDILKYDPSPKKKKISQPAKAPQLSGASGGEPSLLRKIFPKPKVDIPELPILLVVPWLGHPLVPVVWLLVV
jgi:hypothetical protein